MKCVRMDCPQPHTDQSGQWAIWLVAASLVAAPFWFNPLSFNMHKVKADWRLWRLWLSGEVDPDVKASWHTWHRQALFGGGVRVGCEKCG
eukprot:360560-Chlamydomonas_euryale.AAC.4